MKAIFENVIRQGGYDLTGLLKNIDRYHVEGKLTDAEREELYSEARSEALPQYDYNTEIETIWVELRQLRAMVEALAGAEEPDEPSLPEDEWPEYIQPSGAHDAYQAGDRITFHGVHYICLMDNCVWSPLTYPAAWQEQTEPDISTEEITE